MSPATFPPHPAASSSNSTDRKLAARRVVALVGNPNTGKTSLFNALTGYRRHVANYPGVTVDVARGPMRGTQRQMELIDLPGTYSLAAASPDEMVFCDALGGRISRLPRPDAVVAIVDASNLPRNLYLVSQLLEIELPVVIALNMVDVACDRGIEVDAGLLSQRLGVPVIPVVATQPRTIKPLVYALEQAIDAAPPTRRAPLPTALAEAADELCRMAPSTMRLCEAIRIVVDRGGPAEKEFLDRGGSAEHLGQVRQRLVAAGIDPGPAEIRARYAWVNQVLEGVIERRRRPGPGWSDGVDAILTHRVAGVVVLLLTLYGLFYAISAFSGGAMGLFDGFFRWLGGLVMTLLPEGAVRSLVVDGVIAGVGGVLAFLPQIMVLFAVIGLLEDCGYLARAAFMVDRLMRPLGLSGRAFIPLLSSFACAVPAIMGTRAIADRRERFITILIAPFMSCSARLPIYVLLIGAFVPVRTWLGGWLRLDALVMVGLYLLGVVCAIPIAWVLKRTVFAGPPSGFLLELPSYRLPRLRTVWQRAYLAGRGFVVRAGTIILLVNLVVWALGYFPRREAVRQAVEQQRAVHGWDDATFEGHLAGAYLCDSYLGRLGHLLEPVIRPMGWDWRIGVGVIASLPAREVLIATLGTVCNLGHAGSAASLREAIRQMRWEDTGRPLFTLPVAFSLMVFFALCVQCVGTLAVMRRETGSWLWPVVSFVGMTTLAYVAALGVAAGGRALGW